MRVCVCSFSSGGHTNTERGFLPTLAAKLADELQIEAYAQGEASAVGGTLKALKIALSRADQHPLVLV